MLAFWQALPGVAPDHLLPISEEISQHRHHLLGSVLKINHYATPPGHGRNRLS